MKQFDPQMNLYSVAPIGENVYIGRNAVLRGGLARKSALNLAVWLIVATGATPEEIRRLLASYTTDIMYEGKADPNVKIVNTETLLRVWEDHA